MNADVETITINGVEYVKKGAEPMMAERVDGLTYVTVRTLSAGVFAGYMFSRNGQEINLRNARRLWYWEGAASLSQMATSGSSKPGACKFPAEVPNVLLTQAIEVLEVTAEAKSQIAQVPVWRA